MNTIIKPMDSDRSLDCLSAMDAANIDLSRMMAPPNGRQGADIMNALVSMMVHQQPAQTTPVQPPQEASSSAPAIVAGLGTLAVAGTAVGCATANAPKATSSNQTTPQSAPPEKNYTPKWTVTSVKDETPAG